MVLLAVLAVIYYESFGVMKEWTNSQQGFSSDNHLKQILTYAEQGFSSEKYSPHSSSHPLLLVYRVELVNKLVEVVGRLHDRAKQGHESHVVALERSFHICVTSTLKKMIENLKTCV